jgi:hypothetical protein
MHPELAVPLSLLALVLVAVAVMKIRTGMAHRREAERVHGENLERQRFLTARIESISEIMANPDLPLAEVRARTDALVAEMESRNIGGDLDPLIADTTEHLQEEFAKRNHR